VFTAGQLVAHLVGDYLLQSHWMATEKTRSWPVALLHGVTYGLPFLLLEPSWPAWAAIVTSHAVIDRCRLARVVVWVKNLAGPRAWRGLTRAPWPRADSDTGYPLEVPAWLSTWLLIAADNTIHVLCNAAAVTWL
jgi:hypothetical protein